MDWDKLPRDSIYLGDETVWKVPMLPGGLDEAAKRVRGLYWDFVLQARYVDDLRQHIEHDKANEGLEGLELDKRTYEMNRQWTETVCGVGFSLLCELYRLSGAELSNEQARELFPYHLLTQQALRARWIMIGAAEIDLDEQEERPDFTKPENDVSETANGG